jgi:hypothetical protein
MPTSSLTLTDIPRIPKGARRHRLPLWLLSQEVSSRSSALGRRRNRLLRQVPELIALPSSLTYYTLNPANCAQNYAAIWGCDLDTVEPNLTPGLNDFEKGLLRL